MKATVIIPFKDLKEGVSRKTGDAFSCDPERADELKRLNLVTVKDEPKPKKKV